MADPLASGRSARLGERVVVGVPANCQSWLMNIERQEKRPGVVPPRFESIRDRRARHWLICVGSRRLDAKRRIRLFPKTPDDGIEWGNGVMGSEKQNDNHTVGIRNTYPLEGT